MARLFDDASSQYLSYAAAVVTVYPLTMACWFRSNDAAAQQDLLGVYTTSADLHYHRLAARGDIAGDPVRVATRDGTTQVQADTTTGYTANVWAHACGVFTSATSRTAYINGGSSATNTQSRTPSGMDITGIGSYRGLTAGSYMSGDIAEAAVLNVSLTAAEIAILALGVSPEFVRPESIVSYWPIVGYSSPELDVFGPAAMTVTGATVSEHPRTIYQQRRKLFLPVAAAAPEGQPTSKRWQFTPHLGGSKRFAQIGSW